MKLGMCMKVARTIKGLRQNRAAALLGVSGNYLSQIESDKLMPRVEVIEKITSILGVTVIIEKGEVKAELENVK